MRRTVTIVLLVLGGLVPLAGAHGVAKFDSKVTVNDFVANRGGPVEGAFVGKVTSTNDNCATDRKVKLFRKRPGKDRLLGKTSSDLGGDWQIGGKDKAGTYYAKVPKTEIPAGICRKDRSKNFKIFEVA